MIAKVDSVGIDVQEIPYGGSIRYRSALTLKQKEEKNSFYTGIYANTLNECITQTAMSVYMLFGDKILDDVFICDQNGTAIDEVSLTDVTDELRQSYGLKSHATLK